MYKFDLIAMLIVFLFAGFFIGIMMQRHIDAPHPLTLADQMPSPDEIKGLADTETSGR